LEEKRKGGVLVENSILVSIYILLYIFLIKNNFNNTTTIIYYYVCICCSVGSEDQQSGLSEHGCRCSSPRLFATNRTLPGTVRTIGRTYWVRIKLYEDIQYWGKGAGAQARRPHTGAYRVLFNEHSHHSENHLSDESECFTCLIFLTY